MFIKSFFCVLLFITTPYLINGDYYTATSGLEKLLKVEIFMVELLEDYINMEYKKNTLIKNFLSFAQHEAKKSKINSLEYFENPLNAWKTLKRLSREWKNYYYKFISTVNEEEYMKRVERYENELQYTKPAKEDLMGAAQGVARLQTTYNLETFALANGTVVNRQVSRPLSASDCFDLGMSLVYSNDFKNAASWLLEARRRLGKEFEEQRYNNLIRFPQIRDDWILDNLIPTMLRNGHTKLALWLVKDQLTNNPYYVQAQQNLQQIEYRMNQESMLLTIAAMDKMPQKPDTLRELYEKTCRGELKQTPREKRKLRCRYVHNNVPFCFIAPFKMEELNLDPIVAFYHEVIYDSEINRILATVQEKVERSTVGTVEQNRISDTRTSKQSWLWYNQNEFLSPIAKRLTDITGLSLESAEPLQVVNYGIGGHYGPHYDFSDDEGFDFVGDGNRIMTTLFYINNVEYGGATAFPYLRLAIPPIKRSLVVWYNLHRSLEQDYRTKHAGCPVIKGSKWICNQWYHTVGQEFLRPCGLQADGNKSAQFNNLAV